MGETGPLFLQYRKSKMGYIAAACPSSLGRRELETVSLAPFYSSIRWITLVYVENVGSQFLSLRQHKFAN
jgi:hypothetical protein